MKIEDYGFLSDTQTAALVGRNGSVDWLCFPRFDSASCFAALLGEPKNGRWLIAPSDEPAKVTRKYRGHTLILETTFETKDGAVRLIDFMPPRGTNPDIVRIVEGVRGKVAMRMQPEHALRDTEKYWRDWAKCCVYGGKWNDAVVRSLITLKGLTYAPTGGIVAAATTSLPEKVGGVRNWDYRYCWLRDATFTLF